MPEKRKYSGRSEYIIKAVAKRRKKIKAMIIEYKGGQCILCGYKRCAVALDLHHIDRTTKEFGISSEGLTRSWERARHEADKCVLLCANCHRELHAGIVQLPREIVVEKRGELSPSAQT